MTPETKEKLKDVGCLSAAGVAATTLLVAVLWCGWAGHSTDRERDELRARCKEQGGLTYYRDVPPGDPGGLVCVLDGREP